MKYSKLLISQIVITFVFSCQSVAVLASENDLSRADPESVGMSKERLDRIGTAMQYYIDKSLIAGSVTLVSRRGQIVHFEARGYRDVDNESPMSTDTIFRIASMTKPITSVALMMLWEEGKFVLQDPVAKYLPEFADAQVSTTGDASGHTGTLEPSRSQLTIRQVLTHTAGLANRYTGNSSFYEEHMHYSNPLPGDTLEKWVKRLAELPLVYHPGTDWQYSHSTDVVASLVEVISGMSFEDFLYKRILKPLRMTDTRHYLENDKANRLASLYMPDENNRIVLLDRVPVSNTKTLFRGSGGLHSTAADYLRFQQMMLNGGELEGTRILGRKTVELMFANHTGDLFTRPGHGFGLGYAVVLDRGAASTPQSEGTGYWGGAYGTISWIDHEEELIGILMIQLRPYRHLNIRDEFRNLAYQAIID